MKLQPKTQWLLFPRPDLAVDRLAEPAILKLDGAVEWIKRNKPLLWVGSVFSVPEPSRFPSGYALTRSLFDLIIPDDAKRSEVQRNELIDFLMPRWPLEALFDEFEFLDFDLSESLLTFFADLDERVRPNVLHKAVVHYYEQGLSGVPLCVTTNWDTMIEKAFHANGYKVRVGGPSEMPSDDFGKYTADEKAISVYHPHGSFETRDVVCSSFQQQRQLSLHRGFSRHPMLLLGYSGYEPSLYRHLEYAGPQLWCIRDERDLQIPAKRRLLCRRNTQVFVGDMLDLLRALHVLDGDVDLTTLYLATDAMIPPKVIDVIHCSIASTIEPRFCTELLADAICSDYTEPEATFRFMKIQRGIDNHIRNRVLSPELPLGLMSIARVRNHENPWISLLALLLRLSDRPETKSIDRILANAEDARRQHESAHGSEDDFISKVSQARTRCYRSFLGRPERVEDDAKHMALNQMSWLWLGDMALGGELTELAAFHCLKTDEDERARGFFDTAATWYYLTGLWKGGWFNEWASKNIEQLKPHAKDGALRNPMVAKTTV